MGVEASLGGWGVLLRVFHLKSSGFWENQARPTRWAKQTRLTEKFGEGHELFDIQDSSRWRPTARHQQNHQSHQRRRRQQSRRTTDGDQITRVAVGSSHVKPRRDITELGAESCHPTSRPAKDPSPSQRIFNDVHPKYPQSSWFWDTHTLWHVA